MGKKYEMQVISLLFVLFSATALLSANGRNINNYDYKEYGHMGPGHGMMGRGYYGNPAIDGRERLSHEEIESAFEHYVNGAFGKDFHIEEIMEFQSNYYAQIGKNGEETLAVELLADPYTGQVFPEHGPNMMWNQSYGHMGRRFWRSGKAQVSEEESVKIAQNYLDGHDTGLTADDHAAAFDGYYTLHTMQNGRITGMLSINSITGDVWYHDWHGTYLGMEDSEAHHD